MGHRLGDAGQRGCGVDLGEVGLGPSQIAVSTIELGVLVGEVLEQLQVADDAAGEACEHFAELAVVVADRCSIHRLGIANGEHADHDSVENDRRRHQ